jgi:predicted kinase
MVIINEQAPSGQRPGQAAVSPASRTPIVVVAGIPGAGKTTALHNLSQTRSPSASRIIDSESVRRSLQTRLPGVPYSVLRPLVHTVHWAKITALAVTENRVLLIHETATRRLARATLLRIARLARRPARMVWIDVDAEIAREGQSARERVIRPASFRRHLRRVSQCDPAVAASHTWDIVYRTDRAGAVRAIIAVSGTDTSLTHH